MSVIYVYDRLCISFSGLGAAPFSVPRSWHSVGWNSWAPGHWSPPGRADPGVGFAKKCRADFWPLDYQNLTPWLPVWVPWASVPGMIPGLWDFFATSGVKFLESNATSLRIMFQNHLKIRKGRHQGPSLPCLWKCNEMQWIIMISEKKTAWNRTSQDWRIYLFTKNMFGQACQCVGSTRIHIYIYIYKYSIYISYCKCCFYLHMNIHIYVNVPVLVWSINGPEFGRKAPAMEYHKKAKLCLWKRSFSGLLIGDWDKRKKKERERERKSKTQKKKKKKKKEKKKFFFFFFRVPPPPRVLPSHHKPLLETWKGGGAREKKKKKKKKNFFIFSFFFFFFLFLGFGFWFLSLSLFLCLSVKPSGNCGQTETSLQIFGCIWYLRYDWRSSMV